MNPGKFGGEEDLDERLRSFGLVGRDMESSQPAPKSPRETGETVPGVPTALVRRCKASDAARSSRFVVPRAFVDPERAEHTTATLC